MSKKETAKKVSIWVSVAFAILSLFGVPIRPEVVSVVEIINEAIVDTEKVDSGEDVVVTLPEVDDVE